ncbi:MAG: class I SAM-dependent methyltransferase [Candidatus Helarchaeota archaeon]|nr:class I SAM-dependent methyltransferase [Candidatus Helarchaeota archaeon]
MSRKKFRNFYDKKGLGISVTRRIFKKRATSQSTIIKGYGHLKRKYWIDKLLKATKCARFLDIGCADGLYVADMVKRGIYAVGIDISTPYIKKAREFSKNENLDRKKMEFLIADAENLPFIDKCFNVILCSEVLEHLQSPQNCLREIVRILINDLIVSVPTIASSIITRVHLGDPNRFLDPELQVGGHLREYKIFDILHLLKKQKFKIKKTIGIFVFSTFIFTIFKKILGFCPTSIEKLFSFIGNIIFELPGLKYLGANSIIFASSKA